jgi:glycosyltransferase involved in cell wall biosynthesis
MLTETENTIKAPPAGLLRGTRVIAALHGMELFGHEKGNIEVFKTLREMGAELLIGINAHEEGGKVGEHLRGLGFETFPIPFGNQWSWQWLKKSPLSVFEKLRQVAGASRAFDLAIRRFRPTHIHLGSPLTFSYVSLSLIRHRQPLIWRMGDCPSTDSQFNLWIWRRAMQRASKIVVNSRFVREAAIRSGASAKRMTLIYNLAPSFRGRCEGDPEPPAPSTAEIRLIYVGAVSEHKGLLPLVEAFASVRHDDRPNLRLWVLGESRWDHAFRERLEKRAAELGVRNAILFVGHVANPEPWYHAAALHLAPSIWEEPAANVVMEAKRAGTPSIVFPSGGLPEMVRHQVDGFICREKTTPALEEAIRWMLSDAGRLKEMGTAAKEDCNSRFGVERFRQQWASVYSSKSFSE